MSAPETRECTRCEGEQTLVASSELGFGKYECDTCFMVIGYDAEADPREFIIRKGLPANWTKEVFGNQLIPMEQRLVKQ